MRIALIAQFFPPETFAGANRVSAIASQLAELGDLVVIAPEPSYPDPAAYAGYVPPPIAARATLRRIPPFTAQRHSWAVRAAAESRMAARLAAGAVRSRPDVVVTSSPSMFLGPAALAAARFRSARFVWDIRDLTWEYGKEEGVVTGAAARAALGAVAGVMWRTARRADAVVCATEGLQASVSSRLPGARVELVRNGVDEALLRKFDASPPPEKKRLTILYAGLVGHAQGLEVLLDLAELAPDLDVEIAGDGPRREELETEARRRRIPNLSFHGYVSPDRLAGLYHEADVLFGQLRSSPLHTLTAAPSKLLEYMAAGRPIVYGGEGVSAALIEEVGCGVTVAPGDARAAAAAVAAMTVADRERLGARGRAYLESLPSRAMEMRRFGEIVSAVA
jgi:putative colanic acid biosynthesis glycosyltransferase WcaI